MRFIYLVPLIVLYSHIHVHAGYILTQWITDARRTSLRIYVPLTLLQGFEKVIQGLRVRGSWRPNINCNILTSTPMAVNVASFSFSRAAQPEAQRPTLLGDGFLYCIFSATSLVPKLHRGSRGPLRPGMAFPTTSRLSPTGTPIQLSWLSYIIVQRPLDRPLDLWNRMFDRHQAEITVMQFTGHSLPVRQSMSVPWEFFTSSHFISQIPPTRFPLITAIGMCHFLPVHHLGMAFLAGSKGQNTTIVHKLLSSVLQCFDPIGQKSHP